MTHDDGHALMRESAHPARQELDVLAIGTCSGSVGELWQGPAWSGRADEVALLTLHGPNQSITYASPAKPGGLEHRDSYDRLRRTAEDVFYGMTGFPRQDVVLRYLSDIPRGKGMASSTADIVSVIRCLFKLHGSPVTDEAMREILRHIERSDPIFHDYQSIYFSGLQRVYRRFESRVGFYAYWAFGGETTATKHFDRGLLLDSYSRHRDAYAASLSRLVAGMDAGSAAAVAAEATESARLAQDYLWSPSVESLLGSYRELGAAGVVRGHTGSVAGLLFEERPAAAEADEVKRMFSRSLMECYEGSVGLC